jgi:hypothetical protein
MNLISKVVFYYEINAGRIRESSICDDTKELKNVILHSQYEMPFSVRINRVVQIIDTDVPDIERPPLIIGGHEFKNPSICAEINGGHIDFIVADKLKYPQEVRKSIAKDYKNILNLNDITRFEYTPVKSFWLNHAKNSDKQPAYHFYFRPLMENDIVVNKQLQQIWPTKTNQMPKRLVELLSKTKEVVH